MTTTQKLGFDIIATDKTGAAFNSAKKLLDGINGVQNKVNCLGGPMRQAERNTAAFGSRIQNASFQVADFAVQISSGTDATRALAQQLPQLLGGFGIFGAVAGAAVAVLIPLAQAMSKTRDYAKELADGMSKLDEAQKITKASIVDLTEEYGRYASLIGDVAKVRESMARAEIARALSDEAKAAQEVNSAHVVGKTIVGQMVRPLDDVAKSAGILASNLGLTGKAAQVAAEPLRVIFNGMENLNTDAVQLGLQGLTREMEKNKDVAASLGPIYDTLYAKFQAMLKLQPLSRDSMGMAFTPTTAANTYSNAAGDMKVAQQLTDIENRAAEAKRAMAEASRLAAEAQRKETSEFDQFIATVERGVGPLQQVKNTKMRAEESFARFGDKMSPEQFADYIGYVTDLNTKISDLTFKGRWDQMAEGIQTATDAMSPFRSMIEDIGQGLEDSLVNGLTGAFSSFIDGTESAKEALRSFAADFVKQITAMIAKALILYAVQKLIGLASGSTAFGSLTQSYGGVYGNGLLSNANGNAFSGGRVIPFAKGGVVGGPTLFPMANGVGPMGEAGSEAIVPLSRRNGKLGVGASPVNVQINNYAGADVQTRKGNDGQLQIDIMRKVVADDLARGGGVIAQGIERGYGLRRAGR